MKDSVGRYNQYFCRLMIEELHRCGVDYFCLSPGARSTPLTVAVAEHSGIDKQVFHDERAAAFHALGYARATNRPAALICTSGTAVANYLPAIVEASMDMIPMIVLTADRPPELHDCGANQAIKQIGIFGEFVRREYNLPCPDQKIAPEFVLTTIDQAVHHATNSPSGPVHLNCMFREPFMPSNSASESIPDNKAISSWRLRPEMFTRYEHPHTALSDDQVSSISDIINSAKSGLLVVGRLRDHAERVAVTQFAHELGWPVLPDVSSGLRLNADCDTVIPNYDLLLQSSDQWTLTRPAVVLHLGGRVVSKRLITFLKDARFDEFLHVGDHPYRRDWLHQVTRRIECSPTTFCRTLTGKLPSRGDSLLLTKMRSCSTELDEIVEGIVAEGGALNEPGMARMISQNLPPGSGLFVANSMPIRLMDSFAEFTAGSSEDPLPGCNRGASGIDGTIATATGYSAGLARPVTLLIGDLAFLHDLNSLALVNKLKHPMTIVLINNDGGGIFSMLPIAEHKDVFESYFAAPHGLKFAASTEQFGLAYYEPTSPQELADCYRSAVTSKRACLIEVFTNRDDTRALYQRLLDAAKEVVGQ